jgi:hypothetical protein
MGFTQDTAVERRSDTRFAAMLEERWSSLVGIHGGYSAAIVARAIDVAVGDPAKRLRTIAVQFASPPAAGPAEVEVRVERAGRSVTTTSARLLQGDQVRLVAHAVSSPDRPGPAYDVVARPDAVVTGPGSAPLFVPPSGPGHFANAEVRMHPSIVPFGGGDDAFVAAWVRPLADEPIDIAWVVAMCDVLPPAVFSRMTGPVGAASIVYVVHLNVAQPSLAGGGYAYVESRSPLSSGGFAVEDTTMWSPGGEVMAVAHQTRLAGLPLTWGQAAGSPGELAVSASP